MLCGLEDVYLDQSIIHGNSSYKGLHTISKKFPVEWSGEVCAKGNAY